jgi:hypothetical protein
MQANKRQGTCRQRTDNSRQGKDNSWQREGKLTREPTMVGKGRATARMGKGTGAKRRKQQPVVGQKQKKDIQQDARER